MENIVNDYQSFKRDTDLAVEKIRTGAMTMAQGAIELGYQLKLARDTGVLLESGYSTMAEFARAEYGIRPDETTRYMELNDKYSEDGYSRRLKDKYTGIGKTILVDMLSLPEIVRDEITQNFTREDVRALNEELKEENKVTDLEVLMEETDQEQEGLPSSLEKAFYQLRKDLPKLYIALRGAIREGDSQKVADLLAPDGEKIYSLRIPGTGRILLSMKVSEQEVRLIHVRSQEKETFTWQQLEDTLRKMVDSVTDPEEPLEEYAEDFPEEPKEEPKESKPKKSQPKFQKAKIQEKKKVEKEPGKGENSSKVEGKVENIPENLPEEQIPGQDSILNHEEYMPKPETNDTEERESPAAVQENIPESAPEPMDTSEEPVEADLPTNDEPSAGIAPAQPQEVVEKPIRRKEYMDSLTEYGAADYMAKSFREFGKYTFSQLQNTPFWLDWFDTQVDHNGRPWEK